MSLKAVRGSSFWLGAGTLLAFLSLWAGQGVGGETAICREVAVHGQDLAGQLAQPVTEMKQQLTGLGCDQFSLAYWSVDIPTRLRVEVRCRGWMGDVSQDSRRPTHTFGAGTRRVTHESTAGGPPR